MDHYEYSINRLCSHDVIGNTEDFGKNINKIGVCDFAIVGCMFNILNFLSTKAYLMTFLKEKTFASDWIIKELNKLLVFLFLKTHFFRSFTK